MLHYHLQVEFFPETKRLKGSNTITFKALKPGNKMQIDLQPPLAITKITHGRSQLKFEREGNVYWVMFDKEIPKGAEDKIEVFYEGVPVVSKNPPWVGGITWGRDYDLAQGAGRLSCAATTSYFLTALHAEKRLEQRHMTA